MVSVSNATTPMSVARAIQCLSRSSVRTVSYFERSILALRAASARAAASDCGVPSAAPLAPRCRQRPPSCRCARLPPCGRSTGASGESARRKRAPAGLQRRIRLRSRRHRSSANSATRRVSVLNSIALRKAISRLWSGSWTARSASGTSSLTCVSSVTSFFDSRAMFGIVDQRSAGACPA